MPQVCSPVSLTCDVCKVLALPYNNLKVSAGLTPASSPYLWITDKFGNQWSDQVVVAGDGSFTIDTTKYPDGIFNASAGYFDLFLSSDSTGYLIVPMTFSSVAYNCLKLSITC